MGLFGKPALGPKTFVGLDVGGTKIYGGLFDENMQKIQDGVIPTGTENGVDGVCKNIAEMIDTMKDEHTRAIGIAWAGFIDSEKGVIQYSPHIPGFGGMPLATQIAGYTNLPTFMENDARLFTLSEANSVDTIPRSCLGLTFGTGIGGGLAIDGELYTGAHNFAIEVGHMKVGDLEAEQRFTGENLKEFWKSKGWSDDPGRVTARMVNSKEDFLLDMKPELRAFGDWLTNLVIAYDPDDVVWGGSVGKSYWSIWLPEIQAYINSNLKNYPLECNIRISQNENSGGRGAAILAKSKYLL